MNLSPLAVPFDSKDVRVALQRVQLPAETAFHCVLPADALLDGSDDPPAGWVVPGVWEWWSSLTSQLQLGEFGTVRLVVDEPGMLTFGRSWALETDLTVVQEWVAREAGLPSSTGAFTLAWGVTGESGRVACRGAAFSVAEITWACACAPCRTTLSGCASGGKCSDFVASGRGHRKAFEACGGVEESPLPDVVEIVCE